MPLFLDTSALVKLFVQEPGSAAVRQAVATDPTLHVGCLTRHEFLSAVQRRARQGSLSIGEASDLSSQFQRMMPNISMVPFTETLSRKAFDLLGKHGREGLRTLDAVQLACLGQVPGALFCVSDRVLADIAEKTGARVARFL